MMSDEEEYLIKSLQRIYDEVDEVIEKERYEVARSVSKRYNEVLEQFKAQYPDDEVVQSVERVEIPIMMGRRTPENVGDIRFNVLTLADRLDINTDDFGSDSSGGPQNVVRVEQNQSMEQEVTMELIMQLIDVDPQVQGSRDEVKELLREFEDELSREDPEPSVLRQFIKEMREYSTSVAAKMAIRALQAGVVGVLAL